MQINRITNTSFKGAYFIHGNGKNVKEAEVKIENKIKDDGKIYKVGYGYTTDSMPAYILITTGEDAKRYNKFAANKQQELYDCISKNVSEKPQESFNTRFDYLKHKIARDGALAVKIIRENCEFEKPARILNANKVLSAIQNDKFDFKNGKILK